MKRKITLILVTLVLLISMLAIPASASISPESLEATLAPGESVTETKTVHIEEVPPMADVVFAFDLTGSMAGIIQTAKDNADNITQQLAALGSDIQFGVMSYMDYPYYYSSYGYSAWYGDPDTDADGIGDVYGDYAYSLDLSITSNTADVASAINALSIGYGYDGPQDYTRIMYESYADSSVGWRSGAAHILVNFGDNVPHDNNLNEGVPSTSGNWSTGGDPGRDAIILNADDLDLQTVLAAMAANSVTLIEAHTSTYANAHWNYWTGITGGSTYLTGSDTLVDDIVAAVQAALTVPLVNGVHLEASPGYESWVSTDPLEYNEVERCEDDVDFEVTITVPDGTSPGTYTFTISVVDEDGVKYGEQTISVHVVPIPVEIDIKPGSDPNSINLNGNGVVPVGVFGSDTFDVNDINVSTVLFGVSGNNTAAVHSGHIENLNGDEFDDMVLHFREGELGIDVNTPGNTTLDLLLTGKLYNGSDFEGTDVVRITPNNPNSRGKGGKGPK